MTSHLLLPKKVPFPPKKPYIRRTQEWPKERARNVTIAIGIHTPDGIVLCSDSQLTVAGYMKYYGQKIETIWDGEKWSVALTYSGDPERMRRIYEHMRERLRDAGKQVDEPYVKHCFEEALADARSSIIDYSNEMIDALCGFARTQTREEERAWSSKGLHLFSGKSGVVTEVSTEFSILGTGDSSLTRYLERLLSSFGQCYIEYGTALVLGAYIVEQAKKYIDGVGGDLQACLLRSGRPPKCHLAPTETARLVKLGESLEAALQKTVVFSLGVELEDMNFDRGQSWEESLLNALDVLRNEIVQFTLEI